MICLPLVYLEYFSSLELKASAGNDGKSMYEVREEGAKDGDFRFQLKPHPCDRVCKKDDTKRCHFVFIVERTTSLGKVLMQYY